ncbi:DUF6526 family protein [Emticicia sp. BO119]|uniref:DUF6526 family protein n=1 Tax=Emticicia sp. BO119 TaxID=2757768 RepID=UPI0015F067E6|nr:DUF6526 family protein [Emticicia sp. BO119]MBA4850001.1 hypothetical protein [Emticicia sp. BO119]
MEDQNYKNHVRYYTPHHFIFYPVGGLVLGLCIYFSVQYKEQQLLWIVLSVNVFLLMWLSFMLRQHYALMNQDRTVRLEMRFRYYVLTHRRLELIENQLSLQQLLALRFASDEELPDLIQLAIDKKLSPNELKKLVKKWQPDYMRV